uniref:hypothetical protein n=1 Tax=Bacteroides caccae TaxID=47678 RepID=UPI0034A2ABF3
ILHFTYFYKRHTDGTIVGDFDNKITVRFICGKERLLKVGSINSIFYFLHKAAEPFNCLEQDNLA